MDNFEEFEHISYLKDVLMPKIEGVVDKLSEYDRSNEEMKRCVRAFDETMTTKCNKTQLHMLQEDIQSNYITH